MMDDMNLLCTLEIEWNNGLFHDINMLIKNGYGVLVEPIWESDGKMNKDKVYFTLVDKAVK